MELDPRNFKRMLPLPVTVITTMDAKGIANAAPYGCVMPILRPLDLITIASALPRDMVRNIRETRQLVVNVIGRFRFKEAMQTAKNYPAGVNELDEVGLESLPSKKVAPPRIKDALGWIEAELNEEILREDFSLIIGRVVCAEINDAFSEGEKLTEMPALIFSSDYRLVGDHIPGDVSGSVRQFQPKFK
jgi:flavin reductase (DIM6/NTAB) family NADH-FMN oxidoreductase RutF